MNNNGVNNANQQNTNNNVEATLAPMAGVRIAPAAEGPVNASNVQTATSANASIQSQTSSGVPTPNTAMQYSNPLQQTSTATPTPQPVEEPKIIGQVEEKKEEIPVSVPKKKKSLSPLLFLIIVGLIAYIVVNQREHNTQIENLNYNCTPVTASNKETELDINSTLVQDLYNKFYTTIREDIAEPNLNDSMKIYLAYRQVLDKDKYSSNCNLYSKTSMEPFVCEESSSIKPLAIKEETIIRELKVLFGENTNIQLRNIQLGNSCIGGYQYIQQRGEFVEGKCSSNTATSFKATKKIVSATSTRNTIVIKEEVKYHENEKLSLPEYLKSGYYYYTFRLDMNYNYVLVDKRYESKY